MSAIEHNIIKEDLTSETLKFDTSAEFFEWSRSQSQDWVNEQLIRNERLASMASAMTSLEQSMPVPVEETESETVGDSGDGAEDFSGLAPKEGEAIQDESSNTEEATPPVGEVPLDTPVDAPVDTSVDTPVDTSVAVAPLSDTTPTTETPAVEAPAGDTSTGTAPVVDPTTQGEVTA